MTKIEKIRQLRKAVQEFVYSIVSSDEEALEFSSLYPKWVTGHIYAVGDYLTYDDVLYRVLVQHTSEAQWLPPDTPTLYKIVTLAGDNIPIWTQPLGASDAYNVGDIVWYPDENGNKYKSLINGNTWSPEEYPTGWELIP